MNVRIQPRQTSNTPEEPIFFTIDCTGGCPTITSVDYIRINPLLYFYK